MVSFKDTLIIMIVFVVVFAIYSGMIMFCIDSVGYKRIDKNKKIYPYFTNPFYKKIFLLGLKGAINPLLVVSTFLLNISVLVLIITGMWNLISPNLIVSYLFLVSIGAYVISLCAKIISFSLGKLKFK